MSAPILDALVDSVLELLLDERGAIGIRDALSAVTLAFVNDLSAEEQIAVQTQLFSAAIVARIDTRVRAARDLARVTLEGEPGVARRAPETKLDA